MRSTEPRENRYGRFSKYTLTFLFSLIITSNISAKINDNLDTVIDSLSIEKHKLEKVIFSQEYANIKIVNINDIEVFEIEEEVQLEINVTFYLPENFNPLKGKNDLDWSTIQIIEIEEEVELGFDTVHYLPKNFNALKGKNDLDWSTIELIELEEDIQINFDTKAYLPIGFNPYKGMEKNNIKEAVAS